MRARYLIIIFPLLWAFNAHAQVSEETSSAMPEQWQLTLDVIKAKAQTMMVVNNGLQMQYRQLIDEAGRLQESIQEEQDKIDSLQNFLKGRHGRSDQQVQIEQLTQSLKTKKQQVRDLEGKWKDLQTEQVVWDRKIQLQGLRISDLKLQQSQQEQEAKSQDNAAASGPDAQLAGLRKQLEDAKKQEVVLENQWTNLKSGDDAEKLNMPAIEAENKKLTAQLAVLQQQELRRQSTAVPLPSGRQKYDQLKQRRDQLEADIGIYEQRMDQLKESSLPPLSWPLEKKKLVHEMVQLDARNNQMRGQIKMLKEDINVLRDQVAKYERRIDFMQGKETTL